MSVRASLRQQLHAGPALPWPRPLPLDPPQSLPLRSLLGSPVSGTRCEGSCARGRGGVGWGGVEWGRPRDWAEPPARRRVLQAGA